MSVETSPEYVPDPHNPKFWDQEALRRELDRVYDICHLCRRCFNLCPSFPALFDAVDGHEEKGEGEVAALTAAEHREIVDLCFQCKLCWNNCPYHPPHEWMVDFPRLMLRAKAVRVREEGIPLTDRLLGATDFVGRLGTTFSGLMNWANRNVLNRTLMEKTVGIHRDFLLPTYASRSFLSWFRRTHPDRDRPRTREGAEPPPWTGLEVGPDSREELRKLPPTRRVAFFATCTVNYNQPEVGRAALAVLEHNGVEVIVPDQQCCGMPAMDGGDVDGACQRADANVEALARTVEAGYDIVAPGPTCSYTLKHDYPYWSRLERERELVAARSFDLGEYLVLLARSGGLKDEFPGSKPEKVAYHLACHLKAQNIGFRSRDLLRWLGIEVTMIDACTGVDGTWGMKREYYDAGRKVARKAVEGVAGVGAEAVVATDCPLAGQRLEKEVGRAARHPILYVAEAYGLSY